MILTYGDVLAEVQAAIADADAAFARAWLADTPVWVIAKRMKTSTTTAHRLARRLGLPTKRELERHT